MCRCRHATKTTPLPPATVPPHAPPALAAPSARPAAVTPTYLSPTCPRDLTKRPHAATGERTTPPFPSLHERAETQKHFHGSA
ncbi:hypothetical protein WA026_006625, partial [Henosepilachna vigintioctopunctata]